MKKTFTYVALFIASIYTASAQIPNAGFESWSNTSGYDTPDSWDNMNAQTASTSTYTCMQGTPGNQGAAYLKLVTTSVSGMGVIPGIATCGTLDRTNMSAPVALTGFPCTQRPAYLKGMYLYMATNNDQGYISALLTRWNPTTQKRDTAATLHAPLFDMEMSWTGFTDIFNYKSAQYPDTAFITLSASSANPVAGSCGYIKI